MSAQPLDVSTDRGDHRPGRDDVPRDRAAVVSLALVAGAAAVITVLAWKPWPGRDDFAYAQLVPVRDAAWAGSVIDGIGFAVTGVALGLAVCRLARRRGSVWATVGAVATTLGGIVFACGSVAFAVLMWFATSPDLVPVPTGTALLEHVAGHPGHLFVLQMSGFIGYSIGVLVLAVALWRSGSVPRWLPTVFGLLTVALFAGVEGRALDVVEAAQNAMLLGVAWYLWRTCGARSGSRTSPADAVG